MKTQFHFYRRLFVCLSISTILLSSCGRYIPTEIENGKLLGIVPVQYSKGAYVEVRAVPNTSREEVFRQARRWAAFNIGDPKLALSLSDNVTGDLITTGSLLPTQITTKRSVVLVPGIDYAATIECYNNQYRVTLTNFRMNGQVGPHPLEMRHTSVTVKKQKEQLKLLDKRAKGILADLAEFIAGEVHPVSTVSER